MNFYVVIIGTEILNGRRVDKHFEFVKEELSKYGGEIFASFVIKDDKKLMQNVYELVKQDKDAVMFSFGGIGSTPDDLTREIAAKIFTNKDVITHEKFKQDIIDRFQEEAYPHRIYMADIPEGAELLHNPVNNMSGFSLQERYYFVPGFPSMAHPMIQNVIEKNYSQTQERFRFTLFAKTSENTLISLMQTVPQEIEISSLPMFIDEKPNVELSLIGKDKKLVKYYFDKFQEELKAKKIDYKTILN